MSGFHTGFGVMLRCCTLQFRRPATALPSVPFTWNSTSSSRFTRVTQEELIVATIAAFELEDAVGGVVGGGGVRRRRCSSQRVGMWVRASA